MLDQMDLPASVRIIAPAAIGLFLFYSIASTFIAWNRLRQFRGPWLASWSYLWLTHAVMKGAVPKLSEKARKKYANGSPFIRIAPDMLQTDSPEVLRAINAVHSGYRKGDWYHSAKVDPDATEVGIHDKIKGMAAGGYSGREVPGLESDIDGQIESLKRLIRSKYISTDDKVADALDVATSAQYFTVDALTKIAYGDAFGYLIEDDDIGGYIKTMQQGSVFAELCTEIPWIRAIFFSQTMTRWFGPKTTDKDGIGALMKAHSVRHGMTKRQCEIEVLLQLIAGTDSTSNAIRNTLLCLVSTPRAYQRLQKEIDDGIAGGTISSPITFAEGKKLPYLQAVLFESLRLFPSRVVPPAGDTLAGIFVPGGTHIAVNVPAIMQHEPTFGEHAEMFIPERFLTVSADKRREMERVSDLNFGYGRYMCAGYTVAKMELNKIFVEVSIGLFFCLSTKYLSTQLLREFDFQIADPVNPCKQYQGILLSLEDLHMRVTYRDNIKQ
ncbi:cytochrome P450 monooxygenase [Apiospora phragmitis]|uniref:Cytochrome P450 monooxygenase n=1 Tax=Apiospora phragmitis TaxID=2905665 RepID=A0ABR1TVQ5_9PEZI